MCFLNTFPEEKTSSFMKHHFQQFLILKITHCINRLRLLTYSQEHFAILFLCTIIIISNCISVYGEFILPLHREIFEVLIFLPHQKLINCPNLTMILYIFIYRILHGGVVGNVPALPLRETGFESQIFHLIKSLSNH